MLARRLHALDDFQRGVEACGEREVDFVIREIELRECSEIVFESDFGALARADQRGDGRVESGVRAETPADHLQPREAVPQRVEAERDLYYHQDVEYVGHW